jgi:hypothetical protein
LDLCAAAANLQGVKASWERGNLRAHQVFGVLDDHRGSIRFALTLVFLPGYPEKTLILLGGIKAAFQPESPELQDIPRGKRAPAALAEVGYAGDLGARGPS